jgi:adenine-specific DNA-methyltransferase
VLHVGGGRTVQLRNVRLPAKSLSLSAEAIVDVDYDSASASPAVEPAVADRVEEARATPVAILFGPDSGAVSERAVFDAAREAVAKAYGHLYVIGFAIEPNARTLVEQCEQAVGIAATYVQATPDLMMGDLLKNMRSSQIFSVCGLPDVHLTRLSSKDCRNCYQVELRGLDVFDPATLTNDKLRGDDVPAWLLDTDYNGMVFHVHQAFFPRTSAWDALKRALKTEYDDSVWAHLSGTTSTPFAAGMYERIAVKVIDDRGNELMLELSLKDAAPAEVAGKGSGKE